MISSSELQVKFDIMFYIQKCSLLDLSDLLKPSFSTWCSDEPFRAMLAISLFIKHNKLKCHVLLFFSLFQLFIPTGAKKGKSLISEIDDLKEFKKTLRTKTNLLVVFAKSGMQ